MSPPVGSCAGEQRQSKQDMAEQYPGDEDIETRSRSPSEEVCRQCERAILDNYQAGRAMSSGRKQTHSGNKGAYGENKTLRVIREVGAQYPEKKRPDNPDSYGLIAYQQQLDDRRAAKKRR